MSSHYFKLDVDGNPLSGTHLDLKSYYKNPKELGLEQGFDSKKTVVLFNSFSSLSLNGQKIMVLNSFSFFMFV